MLPTDANIDRLARPQHGLIEVNQSLAAGVTSRHIEKRTERGSIERLHAGVYRTMGARKTWQQSVLAACLAAGPQALASHRAAAVLWGLIDPPAPVEITVPYAQCPTPAGTVVHRTTALREVDAARRRGIPVTNPVRTVGDLGAVAPRLVKTAVERGLYHERFTVAGLWRLVDELGCPGRRGIGVLRRTLERRALGADKPQSLLESIFADVAASTGLPIEYQHVVVVEGHRYVLDFALPAALVGIEVDGLETHGTREALDRDLVRQNHLVLAGWHLLRYTATHLRKRRTAIQRELTELVAARLYSH